VIKSILFCLFAAFFAIVLFVSCSGQNTAPQIPANNMGGALPQATGAIPQSTHVAAQPMSSAAPNGPCPQAVSGRMHRMACTPPPTPTPSPTHTLTPTPSPQEITAVETSEPDSYWNYIVTTTKNTYYFGQESTATYNSNHTTLVVRGYLETFTWPTSAIVSILHHGQSMPTGSLAAEPDAQLFTTSTYPQIIQCDPTYGCGPCPDCTADPTNPDGCGDGTDPLVGGCIGAGGVWICINPNNTFYEQGCSGSIVGSLLFQPKLPPFGPFCFSPGFDYTWSRTTQFTKMYNRPPFGAAWVDGIYHDLFNKNEIVRTTVVTNPKLVILDFIHTRTSVSEALSLWRDPNDNYLQPGYCFAARDV